MAIATNWKKLSGEDDWKGLLDPIDDNLRRYLLHYGGFTRAPGDSFNYVKASPGYALCRFPPEELFTRVGLQNGNAFKYLVTDYLYAWSDYDVLHQHLDGTPAFIGFVAVSTDEGKLMLGRRDIMVSWRGSTLSSEWFEDFNFEQVLATDLFPNSKAKIHSGFYDIYTGKSCTSAYTKMSVREQVQAAVRRLVDKYYTADPNEEVSITVVGHSLGASLATLNAVDLVANGYNKPTRSTTEYPVASFAYASPRVGDQGFLDVFSALNNFHVLRIRNKPDMIPELPPKHIMGFTYADVGVELEIDTNVSPYVRKVIFVPPDHMEPHDLNLYCHGISGYQGKHKEFKLAVSFDLALVNKYNDLVLEEYKVPSKWWSNVLNQGMLQMDDGSWKLNDYVPDPPRDDATQME